VELDREKARTLGVPVDEVFQTMSAAMGGAYVIDFNCFGRLYRGYVQAAAAARLTAEVMGTGVFWGMLVATAVGVFIIPGNYTFIEGLGRRRPAEPATVVASPEGAH